MQDTAANYRGFPWRFLPWLERGAAESASSRLPFLMTFLPSSISKLLHQGHRPFMTSLTRLWTNTSHLMAQANLQWGACESVSLCSGWKRTEPEQRCVICDVAFSRGASLRASTGWATISSPTTATEHQPPGNSTHTGSQSQRPSASHTAPGQGRSSDLPS